MEAKRADATRYALALAQQATDRKNTKRALQLLEYAQRLAPSDRAITFDIGRLRLARGDKRAAEAFELVAQRNDVREAWLALGSVRFMAGDAEGAAVELDEMLRRHALPDEAGVFALLDQLVIATGAHGWSGIDSAGRLTLGLRDPRNLGDRVSLALDGERVPTPLFRTRRGMRLCRAQLQGAWARTRVLDVRVDGVPLLGSRIDASRIQRAEGFVTTVAGDLEGWCWFPADPDRAPLIRIASRDPLSRHISVLADEFIENLDDFPAFAKPRRFRASAAQLRRLLGPLDVTGPDGRALYGSPAVPHDEANSVAAATQAVTRLFPAHGPPLAFRPGILTQPSVAATAVAGKPRPVPPAVGVDVVIPVYLGRQATLDCIASVLAEIKPHERVVVVVDATPDQQLVQALESIAARGDIVLELRSRNSGFPATANFGLRQANGRDVVLLNSDTLVTPGWLDRLRAAVHSAPDIGTATPLSNDATIFSYPNLDQANPFPGQAEANQLAGWARSANDGILVEVPTAHGFCMYMRAACIAEAGVLRDDVFGQGYGEENDWSLRASHLGWRHVAVPGAYVAHVGGQSFAATKTHLIRRNLAVLNRLHFGYDAAIAAWQAADPLRLARRAIDLKRWAARCKAVETVLLITHDRGGGVKRHVLERAIEIRDEGRQPMILSPMKCSSGEQGCTVDDGSAQGFPNLVFALPSETADLETFLTGHRVAVAEVHHLAGHSGELMPLLGRLGVPHIAVVHDYAWFCPRITLSNRDDRYCGEPDLAGCQACVADYGTNIETETDPGDLVLRSRRVLEGARMVLAPSQDAVRRMERRFGVPVEARPWEEQRDFVPARPQPRTGRRRRICVAGAIGPEKGYQVLLDLSRLITVQRLPIELVIVGFTCDDKRLLTQDCVTITGRYEDHEAVALIRAQNADFGFLPALWPETWSYVLTQLWDAGLMTAVFDIGAPAERVKSRGWGTTVPLNLSIERLAGLFMRDDLFSSAASSERQEPRAKSVGKAKDVREPSREVAALSGE